jgi:hypothetical protein
MILATPMSDVELDLKVTVASNVPTARKRDSAQLVPKGKHYD